MKSGRVLYLVSWTLHVISMTHYETLTILIFFLKKIFFLMLQCGFLTFLDLYISVFGQRSSVDISLYSISKIIIVL